MQIQKLSKFFVFIYTYMYVAQVITLCLRPLQSQKANLLFETVLHRKFFCSDNN